MYGLHVVGYVGIAILVSAITSPTIFGEDLRSDFLGRSSEDITQLLFKNSVQNETNFIFSPFGYSMILGILSEGARGETREELRRILHSPQDTNLVRENFRTTLERLQEKAALANTPEYRNYFYVYKNFTVDDEYKRILLENYFTEVRSVENVNYDDFAESTSISTTPQAKPIAKDEQQQQQQQKILSGTVEAAAVTTTLKKGDKNDKITHDRIKRWAKRFLGINLDGPSKRELSNVSAGRLQGAHVSEILSKMIVFNGLYFNGAWKTPFQYKQGEEPFYTVNNEKVMTKMMYTVGQFRVGRIPELESTAICIPYKGERYSFLVIYADNANGTRNLIRRVKNIKLTDIHSRLETRHIQISIPSFEFNSVTYLKESLKTIGIHKIFTEEADFNGLSKDKGLFVDDVVQLVTIKVDGEMAAPNFLTASSVQTRTVMEKFTVDRPFVFLVQDHKENLVIAAGKLYVPTKEEENNQHSL